MEKRRRLRPPTQQTNELVQRRLLIGKPILHIFPIIINAIAAKKR
jgi:hypothetical protein